MIKTIDKTNVEPASAAYPYGDVRDIVGLVPGTPVDKELLADYVQFFEKMFAESGITANDLPDNETNGFQLYEAFRRLTKQYKSYTGLITQVGTSNPTVNIIGANEIGNIVWTRTGVGTYIGTLAGAFTVNKSYIVRGLAFSSDLGMTFTPNILSPDSIGIQSFDLQSGVLTDGLFDTSFFEIRVYD